MASTSIVVAAATRNRTLGDEAATAESLWKTALESLKDEHKKAINFQCDDKLTILEDILQAIEKKKEACREKRWKYMKGNKEIIVRDQLEKIVAWVNKFKEIGDLAVQYDPVHAALPWAGVRFFLQVPVSYFETASAMWEGLEVVSNLIARGAILEKLYLKIEPASDTERSAQEQFTNAVLKLYVTILKFFSKARNYYDFSTFKKLARTVVQTPNSSIGVYIDKLEKSRMNVEACAHLMDSSRSCNMSGNLLRLESMLRLMNEPMHRSASQLSDLKDFLKEEERKMLFTWLSNIQHRRHHKTVGRDFLSKSGQWLVYKPQFMEWKNESSSSMLWLLGIPGSGKTKLVYSVIEHLQTTQSAHPSPPLFAYFYCTRSDAERERANPDEIMRSILKQLSCSKASLPIREPVAGEYKKLKDEADEDGSEAVKWTISECVDLIIQILQDNPATIIVDALDECDPKRRHELLLAFDEIIQKSANVVKIFASSREDDDIKCRLEVSPNVFIHASDNGEDIQRFVHDQVDRAIKERRLLSGDVSDDLKGRIIRVLTEKSQGMFRWAELQMQNLCDVRRMKHENDINQELGRLPTTLRTSYDLIYQQIIDLGATSRGIVERTLSWLLSAQRTLKPKEIIAAVSLGSDGIQIPLNVDQLLGMCCNLVLLDEEIKTLRFAHLSVREYLEDHGDYDASRRHALVLDRCLNTYLLHLSKISKLARFSQSAFDRDHLSRYSTIYWPIHCQLAGGILPNFRPTKKLLRFVFEGSGPALSFQAWTIYGRSVLSPTLPINLRDRLTWIFLSPPHPLFSACSFGFCWVFDTLTELGYSDWNQWGHECRSGLHVAAEYGLSNAITLLMNRGVDVNAVDGKYFRSAISWAAENAHAESVELLLDHGAMVGSNSGKPPLMCAAKNGDQKMVELLLSRGADPDKEGDSYMNRTALGWAVYNGHRAIVELLLNASGNGKMLYSLKAALMSAAQSGHYDILELLLGKGRKADIKEEDMSAMLLKATANRHTAVVDLLLRKGAWTETRTFEGKTPLILAAQDGHCRIMQLLLDSGAHIDHRNESGESALLIAVEKGDIEVVKLLLARGASVNQRDRSGESALLRAAVNGNMALVELLLSKGASIDIKDKGTGSALLRAAERGNVTSVKLLLSRGANIEAKTPRAVTPLIMAAQLGHEKVVEVLLSNQANIEAETMEGKTPLILAAQYGYEKIVEILLLNRATIDARDSDGNTPLLKASSKRIIELLISKGADVKDANQEGITLLHLASTGLHAASRSGDGKLVELLLSKGAVKMQEDAIGRTAYDMALNNSNFAVLELLNDWQRKPLGLDEYSGALIFSPKVYGHFRDIMSRAALVLSRGIPSDEPQTPVTGEKDEFTKRLRRLRRRRRLITYELITDVSDQDSRRHETNTADADVPKYPAYYDNTPFNPDPNEADEGPEIVQQLLLEWSPLQTNRKERMEWIVLASLYLTTFIIVVFPAILVFPSVTTDILWYFILFCASIFLVHLCGGLEKFNNTKGVLQFRHQEVGDIRLRN